MKSRLMAEIKQTQPFESLEEEALLNLVRTADRLARAGEDLLARHGLSGEQYNVLRILRGAGAGGLPCGEVGARMLTRNPDVTRLLDRLAAQGLATRRRDARDRRVVVAFVSRKGLRLLARLDLPLRAVVRGSLKHLSKTELRAAIRLLERMRTPPERPARARAASRPKRSRR
ncbi:MAG: winged helix-turn-helix transcriptional regulator [Planctomycetota bacterium]|nr:winged helix-turn-helix transcriptional regulator [Planctomycetota bacterium]